MKFVALILAAAVCCGAAPAGVTAVQQADALSGIAGVQVFLQAGVDRETPAQNGLAALVAEMVARTPENGAPLEDAVKAAGGTMFFTMEPGRVRFYTECAPATYASCQQMLGAALAKPDFSQATLDDARKRLNGMIAADQHSALRVGMDMLNRSFYQNSDAGLPRYGMSESLAGFSVADARAFYTAHYRRGDAVVSAAGTIPVGAPSAASVVADLPPGSSSAVVVRQAKLPAVSRELIARRDVSVPWLVAQYRAPDMSGPDFGAMLILTQFMQRTLSEVSDVPTIATRPQSEQSVGAYYNFDAKPANVIVYVDGGLGDPARTFSTALGVVGVLGQARLGGDLAQLKNYALGRLLESSQTVEERALLGGIYAARGLSPDYRAQITKAINNTTATDLQRVASRYLNAPTIALVLPRSTQAQ